MRIGELSVRTGASRRLLRYYEEQGLLTPERCANGYRRYDEPLVDRVHQIRGLLAAGLPTRLVAQVLPCLDSPGVLVCPAEATPELVMALREESSRMTRRITALTRNRDALDHYLANLPPPARPEVCVPGRREPRRDR